MFSVLLLAKVYLNIAIRISEENKVSKNDTIDNQLLFIRAEATLVNHIIIPTYV